MVVVVVVVVVVMWWRPHLHRHQRIVPEYIRTLDSTDLDSCVFVDVGRPLWLEIGSVVYSCWARQRSLSRVRVPLDSWPYFYCLKFETPPNLKDQVPVFISPRNRVAQLHPRHWLCQINFHINARHIYNSVYTRPLSVKAQYCRICPIKRSSGYNGSLVTWKFYIYSFVYTSIRPLSVKAQYCRICPINRSSGYNGSLVTWKFIRLTTANRRSTIRTQFVPHRKHLFVAKTNRFMLFREIIVVYS
jgi:hypothetical protein